MNLIRVSLFLTLLGLATCSTTEADDIIGVDSDLIDDSENVTYEAKADDQNVTTENKDTKEGTAKETIGEDLTDENVTGEIDNVTSENKKSKANRQIVTEENYTGEIDNVTDENVTNEVNKATEITASRRFLDLFPHNGKKCPCFPTILGGKTISQILKPVPGSKNERLVIYLYKNTVTNAISIYVPNSKKQVIYPDVFYERDDHLYSINTNAIDIVAHELGPVIEKWIHIRPWPTPRPTPRPTPKPTHRPDLNLDIFDDFSPAKLNSLIIYLKRFKETRDILNNLHGLTPLDKILQLKLLYPDIYARFLAKIIKFFPVWLNKGKIVHYTPGNLINFPYDVSLIPALHGHYKDIIVYKPPVSVIQTGELIINSNLNIDSWLSIIVRVLNNLLKFAAKVIDSELLKSIIIKLLQNNSLTVNTNGKLVDASGRVISWGSIVLRPILIGESSLVRRIINNGLYRIPTSIVFLEALLVSGTRVKSLGIIPIGNIFVGSGQVEVETNVVVVETTVVCENGQCRTIKKCKNMSGQEVKCSDYSSVRDNIVIPQGKSADSESDEIKKAIGRSGKCNKNKCKSNCKNKHNCGSYVHPMLVKNDRVDAIRTGATPPIHFPSDNLYHGRPGLSDESQGATVTRIIPGKIKSGYDVWSDQEPGIRIVGGTAATGSGTPLNSKG